MTVSSTINREQYATNGVTTAFTIHFPFFDDTDVNAVFVTAAGVSTTFALNTDFTVTGGAVDGGVPAGGTLACATAPANGGTLTIYRDIPATQESDYVEDDPLPADQLEADLDRSVIRDQQLKDGQDRALTFPVTVAAGVSGVLPIPVADAVLGFASDGLSIEAKALPAGTAVYSSIANTRAGTATGEAVTPDGLASTWQEGGALVSAASIAKPSDVNLGGVYTQSGNTGTNTYWAGVVGGERMWVRYTGTPLLGVSGNLLPPGGVAFQVIAGDMILWIWDAAATKWRAYGGAHADGSALVGVTVPRFSANKNNVDQGSVTSATETKVTFTTEVNDIGGYYDAPNSKYTPPAGTYLFTARLAFTVNVVDQSAYYCILYKNGVAHLYGFFVPGSGTGSVAPGLSVYAEANGTDYFELFAFGGGAGAKTIGGTVGAAYFQAARVA